MTARPIPGGWRDVASALDRSIREKPDAEALIGRYGRYSFRDLDAAIDAAAAALTALGVASGDRVAASAANHPELVIAFFAVQRLGAIWVGVNRALAPPEKLFQLQDSEAKVFLADAGVAAAIAGHEPQLPALRHVVDMEPGEQPNAWLRLIAAHRGAARPAVTIDPQAPAAIAYTSGTTGRPKGAVHSQHNLIVVAATNHEGLRGPYFQAAMRRGSGLPLTTLNLMILGPLTALSGGGACVLMDRADAIGVAEWIAREAVETLNLAPATLFDFLKKPEIRPEQLRSLTFLMGAGAAVSDEMRRQFRERFGVEFMGGYGQTEAPTSVTYSDPTHPRPPGAVGRVVGHLDVAILDGEGRRLPAGEAGEICVRAAQEGPWANVYTPMLGYWRRDEATAQALRGGWLHTGDVGVLDDDGYLYVKDRITEMIIRGGANVYPAEVERVLADHPRVRAAAVVGKPDERLGEIVAAFVEVAPGAQSEAALVEELKAACLAQIARYKVPEIWRVTDEMPRNAMNKILKGKLKERL